MRNQPSGESERSDGNDIGGNEDFERSLENLEQRLQQCLDLFRVQLDAHSTALSQKTSGLLDFLLQDSGNVHSVINSADWVARKTCLTVLQREFLNDEGLDDAIICICKQDPDTSVRATAIVTLWARASEHNRAKFISALESVSSHLSSLSGTCEGALSQLKRGHGELGHALK
jgi:hypothetical protein